MADDENLPRPAMFRKVPMGKRLIDGSFEYSRTRYDDEGKKEYLHCSKRSLYKCKATALVSWNEDSPVIVGLRNEHNHDNCLIEAQVNRIADLKVKETAGLPAVKPKMVLAEITKVVNKEVGPIGLSALPNIKTINRRVARARKKASNAPKTIPKSFDELVIPPEFASIDGSEFLRIDKTLPGGLKLLGFFAPAQLDLLCKSEHSYLDGTFNVCTGPGIKLFSQMLIFQSTGPVGNTVPTGYLLLPGKAQWIYEEAFRALRTDLRVPPPARLNVDFELAMINAWKLVYPETRIQGCQVHYERCFENNVKSRGLKKLQLTSQQFQTVHRMLAGVLPMVPPAQVPECFYWIWENVTDDGQWGENKEAVESLMTYVEDTWVGKWEGGETDGNPKQTKLPRYDIQLWNQNLAIREMLPKTTNSAEGYNNALRSLIPANSGLWTVLSQLSKEALTVEVKIRDAALASPGNSSRGGIRFHNAKKVKNLVEKFDKMSYLEFFLAGKEFFNLKLI